MCFTTSFPASDQGGPEGLAFYSPQFSVVLESEGKAKLRRLLCLLPLAVGMWEGQPLLPNNGHICILFAQML